MSRLGFSINDTFHTSCRSQPARQFTSIRELNRNVWPTVLPRRSYFVDPALLRGGVYIMVLAATVAMITELPFHLGLAIAAAIRSLPV